MVDNEAYGLVRQVIENSAAINRKVVSLVHYLLRSQWHDGYRLYERERGKVYERLEFTPNDLKTLRESFDTVVHDTELEAMSVQLHTTLLGTQKIFDDIITFIIQRIGCRSRVHGERIMWEDWYSSTEEIGDDTWRHAVQASKVIVERAPTCINTLQARLRALDRVLDVLSEAVVRKARKKFSLEYWDTMYVLYAISM